MGANPTLLTLFYSRDNEIYIYGQQKLENDELEQQWYQFEGSLVTKENGVRRSTRGMSQPLQQCSQVRGNRPALRDVPTKRPVSSNHKGIKRSLIQHAPRNQSDAQ